MVGGGGGGGRSVLNAGRLGLVLIMATGEVCIGKGL